MNAKFIFLLLISFSVGSKNLKSDETIVMPGSSMVTGMHINASVSKWRVSAIDSTGVESERGIWTDKIEIISYKGIECIKRSQIFVSTQGKVLQNFSAIMDRKTMIPYYNDAVLIDGTISTREFDGSKVTVIDKFNSVEKKRTMEVLESSVFDFFGGNFGILISGFPLEEGKLYKFPSENHDAVTNKEILQWVNFKVLKEEMLDLPVLGKTKAHRVEAALPNALWIFWLNKSKAPYLCQLILKRKNGTTSKWSLMEISQ